MNVLRLAPHLDLAPQRDLVDPAILEDPVAAKTDWEPANPGGNRDMGRRLRQGGADRWVFKTSLTTWLKSALFGAMGIGMIVLAVVVRQPLMLIVGVPFVLVVVFTVVRSRRVITFDLANDRFDDGTGSDERTIGLGEIHALQLLSERVRGGGRRRPIYNSHELNLILTNGDRINVIDQADIRGLRRDAFRLGEILDKPVWDQAMYRGVR